MGCGGIEALIRSRKNLPGSISRRSVTSSLMRRHCSGASCTARGMITVMELVANSMDWAQHRRRKAAAKVHLRYLWRLVREFESGGRLAPRLSAGCSRFLEVEVADAPPSVLAVSAGVTITWPDGVVVTLVPSAISLEMLEGMHRAFGGLSRCRPIDSAHAICNSVHPCSFFWPWPRNPGRATLRGAPHQSPAQPARLTVARMQPQKTPPPNPPTNSWEEPVFLVEKQLVVYLLYNDCPSVKCPCLPKPWIA